MRNKANSQWWENLRTEHERKMTMNKKAEIVNKVLAKVGTSLNKVSAAMKTYWDVTALYMENHAGEAKDEGYWDVRLREVFALTSKEHDKPTMKCLVKFLAEGNDIEKSEAQKWVDYVEVQYAKDAIAKARAMVKWDMKYHADTINKFFNMLAK